MIKKIVLKPRMSALNYEFLARPTRMEGKNVYCDIKVCQKCVTTERYNRCEFRSDRCS